MFFNGKLVDFWVYLFSVSINEKCLYSNPTYLVVRMLADSVFVLIFNRLGLLGGGYCRLT